MYSLKLFNLILVLLASSNVRAEIPRTWERVALGSSHTCGILKNKEVLCWGHNYSGQLGLGRESIEGSETRPQRLNITGNPKKITLSGDHSCVLLEDNTVKCWGENSRYLLGDGLYRLLGPIVLGLADNPKCVFRRLRSLISV